MPVLLVFNELSVGMATSLDDAKRQLEVFAGILVDQRIKAGKVLVVPTHFLQLQVSAGCSFGRLLAVHRYGDHERRLRVKTIVDHCSYFSDQVPIDELESHDVEYTCARQPARGLFVAFASDGLAVSLPSSVQWDAASIDIEKAWIDGEYIQTRTLNVLHACRAAHLEVHLGWLRQREPPPPANGAELWESRESLFPNLDFCGSVEEQIKILRGNEPRFRAVMRGLQDLQNYCESWNTQNFDIHQLNHASGESQSTLNMYSNERTFRCPDGEPRLFDWHLKRGDTRIHFFDFPEPKRILVGYAGAHLRISSQ